MTGGPMGWQMTDDPETFASAAGHFLATHRVELTVPVSILTALRLHGPSFFSTTPPRLGWFDDGSGVSAVVTETPPHALVVSTMPPAAAAALPASWPRPERVLGPADTVHALAGAWGTVASVQVHERLHRLAGLVPPQVTGSTRLADPSDADLLWTWIVAFRDEAVPQDPPPRRAGFESGLEERRLLVHVVDDAPVAFASVSWPELGVSRIGPVYTPPASRRRGYGAAVTAAAACLAADRGAEEVLLFTDLANPTSNALYARLGFVPVTDVVAAIL